MSEPEQGRRAADHLRRSRLDLDVRGIIAILAMLGAFGLAFVLLLDGKPPDIPAWAATTVGAIVGFYFGSRGGGAGNGH